MKVASSANRKRLSLLVKKGYYSFMTGTRTNFLVKVTNAKLSDIRRALRAAQIDVRSIAELHREEMEDEKESPPLEGESPAQGPLN